MVAYPPAIRALELLSYRDHMPVEVLRIDGTLVAPTDWASVSASEVARVRIDRPPISNFVHRPHAEPAPNESALVDMD